MKNTVRVERAIVDITQQQLADAIGVSRNTSLATSTSPSTASSSWTRTIDRQSLSGSGAHRQVHQASVLLSSATRASQSRMA